MMEGEGTYKWLDGRLYHGQFKNDKKNGFGVYIWADARAYIGNWTEGKQDEERVYILPNGTVKKGRWVDNKRVGDWLPLEESDKEAFIVYKNTAVKKAQEVEVRRRQATEEVDNFIKGQNIYAEKHDAEKLVDADQIIEEIEHQQQEEQQEQFDN